MANQRPQTLNFAVTLTEDVITFVVQVIIRFYDLFIICAYGDSSIDSDLNLKPKNDFTTLLHFEISTDKL